MNPLAPLKTLFAGTAAACVVSATCVALFVPDARTLPRLLLAFAFGVVPGLIVFGPIAGALAFRAQLVRWLDPHGYRIQWTASLLMAGALGYLLAASRHGASDVFDALALVILFLCAMFKVVMGIAFQSTSRSLGDGGDGGSSSYSSSPVPRPDGGRPPELTATEPLPQEAA